MLHSTKSAAEFTNSRRPAVKRHQHCNALETEIDMASEALGSAYVLSDTGARQLADMAARGSAPLASPGFSSRLHESASAARRLSDLERLVRAHTPTDR